MNNNVHYTIDVLLTDGSVMAWTYEEYETLEAAILDNDLTYIRTREPLATEIRYYKNTRKMMVRSV